MRIVHVNPFHYPFLGGIEHRIHHISTRLARKHEVMVLTGRMPNTIPEERIDGYSVKRLDSSYIRIYNPPHVRTHGVLEELEKLEPDVVDFHYRWSRTYTKAVLAFKGPKIFTWHNTFGEGEGAIRMLSKLNDILFSRHIDRFTRIACVSEFVMKDLETRGFPADKLRTVPNGVEMPRILSKEGDFILFVGRLVKTKGLVYLLEAMTGIDAPLIVCGAGPEMERLVRKAAELNISNRVTFMGCVTEEVKQELLSTCKIFAFPSTWESYGIAAAEAMSYGKPVVASDVGGLPEVVGNGGLLIPPKNPNALTNAINGLLEDDRLRAELGVRACKLATAYTWDNVAERMERVYIEAVETA